MLQIRIIVKLGGRVGELNLSKRDLADLTGIQPKLAGEWVSGGIERISLVDLARIMMELELFSLDDVFDVEIIGDPPLPEGRKERIKRKLEPMRAKRKAENHEYRLRKEAEKWRRMEEQVKDDIKRQHRRRK